MSFIPTRRQFPWTGATLVVAMLLMSTFAQASAAPVETPVDGVIALPECPQLPADAAEDLLVMAAMPAPRTVVQAPNGVAFEPVWPSPMVDSLRPTRYFRPPRAV